MTCILGAHRDQKRALVPLEMELQVVVHWYMGAGSVVRIADLTTELSLAPDFLLKLRFS